VELAANTPRSFVVWSMVMLAVTTEHCDYERKPMDS